ncbi:MAG: DUF4410 domain-containing protein [Desulfobacteraceae bacterium]
MNPELLRDTCVVLREFSTNAYAQNGAMAMTQCKNSAYQYLSSKGLFKAVENASDKSCDSPVLFVDARLIDLRIVSKAARFWGGAFSGRSHMKIFVEITDQEGQSIAQKELFGAPNAMGAAWSFGSSDTNLPYHMGRLLADYVVSEAARITN